MASNFFDRLGRGELQMNSAGTQLVFYNRKRYLAGFDYQEPELQIMKLTPDRTALDGSVLTVAGLPSGTGLKGSAELVTVTGEQLLYFNQYGLFRSINASATDYLHFASLVKVSDDETLQLDSKGHFGDLRRSYEGANTYMASVTDPAAGQLQLVGAQANPGAASPQASYLPGQPFRKVRSAGTGYRRTVGQKPYELKDHLGNVHAVVTDRRKMYGTGSAAVTIPEVKSLADYYPFGMQMPGKKLNPDGYRYGFNGKEDDNEVNGWQDYGFREYNRLTGKFITPDPLFKDIPWNSTYAFAENDVIRSVDLEGLEKYFTANGRYIGNSVTDKSPNSIRIATNYSVTKDKKVVIREFKEVQFQNPKAVGETIEGMWNSSLANKNAERSAYGVLDLKNATYSLVVESDNSNTTPYFSNFKAYDYDGAKRPYATNGACDVSKIILFQLHDHPVQEDYYGMQTPTGTPVSDESSYNDQYTLRI